MASSARAATLFLAGALAVWIITACSGGGSGGGDAAAPPLGIGTEFTHAIASQHTGASYEVTVYVPEGYEAGRDAKPALYVLDKELQFTQARDIAREQRLDVIVVAVSYGSPARRFVDFELPGAQAYYRFVTLELLPFIEAQYRIEPTRRTLMGYSLSGLMATLALFLEEPSNRYFSSMVVTDASFQFHTQDTLALEQATFERSQDLPVALSMCYTFETTGVARAVPERIATHGYRSLRMRHQLYVMSHAQVLVPCITDGLQFIFNPR